MKKLLVIYFASFVVLTTSIFVWDFIRLDPMNKNEATSQDTITPTRTPKTGGAERFRLKKPAVPSGLKKEPKSDAKQTTRIETLIEGVRQDVRDQIDRLYAESPDKKQHALLAARNFQRILDEPRNLEETRLAISKEVACRMWRFDAQEAVKMGRLLEGYTFNTASRINTYLEWNGQFDGRLLKPQALEASACDL